MVYSKFVLMFIIIFFSSNVATCSSISGTIVHFKKTEKKFFVKNFCVPEL